MDDFQLQVATVYGTEGTRQVIKLIASLRLSDVTVFANGPGLAEAATSMLKNAREFIERAGEAFVNMGVFTKEELEELRTREPRPEQK